MIYKQIRDDMMQALKEKRVEDKNTLSLLYSQMKNKAIDLRVAELSDDDCFVAIQKFIKSAEEEKDIYGKAGRDITEYDRQIKLVQNYLPKQLTEDEIRSIIISLDDKSIPNVMKTFKSQYNGKVDMKLVNQIVREING